MFALRMTGISMNFLVFRDFEDGETLAALGYDIVLRRRTLGTLVLPSGSLIACDPLASLETEPFMMTFAPGSYPFSVILAELRDEIRVAYSVLKVGAKEPLRWEKALVSSVDRPSIFDELDEFGYSVESSVGCFVDADTATALLDYQQLVLADDNEYERALHSRVRKRRRNGFGWTNIDLKKDLKLPVEDGRNLIAFETGYGPGVYSTYLGRDEDDAVVSVVTDFEVLDLRFPSFPFRGGRR
jgi:hypothetical protein